MGERFFVSFVEILFIINIIFLIMSLNVFSIFSVVENRLNYQYKYNHLYQFII